MQVNIYSIYVMYQQQNILIFEDNQSTIKMIENEGISQRSKHIDIRYHSLSFAIIRYQSSSKLL